MGEYGSKLPPRIITMQMKVSQPSSSKQNNPSNHQPVFLGLSPNLPNKPHNRKSIHPVPIPPSVHNPGHANRMLLSHRIPSKLRNLDDRVSVAELCSRR